MQQQLVRTLENMRRTEETIKRQRELMKQTQETIERQRAQMRKTREMMKRNGWGSVPDTYLEEKSKAASAS